MITAGGIKYKYDGDVIDLMGLNNLHVAHNAGRRIGLKNHAAFEKQSLYDLQPAIVAPLLVNPEAWRYSHRRQSTSRSRTSSSAASSTMTPSASLYRYCLVTRAGARPAAGARGRGSTIGG